MRKFLVFLFAILFLTACSDDTTITNSTIEVEDAQNTIADYLNLDISNLPDYENQDYPVHYNNQVLNNDNTPANNPVTNEGATLGRVLFFDKNLSINNTVSCASCHQQNLAFTDQVRFSVGFNGVDVTGAHSMRLLNAKFYEGINFFWDKRAATLEEQTTQPIQNEVEMGFDAANGGMEALIEKLNELPYYAPLFEMAFGDDAITEQRMQFAMAQYIRCMVSVDSEFDTAYAQNYNPAAPDNGINADFPQFTAQENLGKSLFLDPPPQGGVGCASCHQAPTFALNDNSLSNGLDAGETTIFKSPSLKNVATSAHFMHDGRFDSLEEVVEHYNSGIQAGPALDNRLRMPGTNNPIRLNLTDDEKAALVAFMNTLTDTNITTDSKFNDPFITN